MSLKKILVRFNKKNNICINIFCYKNDFAYPVYISNEKFENFMNLLLITIENKLIYV